MPGTPSDPWIRVGHHDEPVGEAFPAVAEAIGSARRSVTRWLRTMAIDDEVIGNVALAVSEACTNAVIHGYRHWTTPGFIEVAAHRAGQEIRVSVSDVGCGTSPRPDSPGMGLGLPLMKALTTRLDVRAGDGGRGTVVTMTFDAAVPTDVDDLAGSGDAGAAPRAGDAALSGDVLLAAVTDAMVALHLRYYHRTPATGKSQLLGDDLLACTLGGIYTDVEKTLIELQHHDVVRSTRHTFETAMQDKFIEAVERLSGREVTSFVSNHHVGPDMAVELFMLGPEASRVSVRDDVLSGTIRPS